MGLFSRARKPLFAFTLGCLCSAVVAESALRIFGESFRARAEDTSGQATVICLGNSFTAGIGADPGHAYCDYLQRYIDQDQRLAPLKLHVVNLGESSKNSTMILADLPAVLDRYRPRLALLMVGEPNQWNKLGLSQFESTRAGAWAKLLASTKDSLIDLRLYRFAVLAMRAMSEKQTVAPRRFPHVARENVANLGFRWLGHLYEPNVPNGKPLPEEESKEAFTALLAIAEKYPRNPVIPLVIARQRVTAYPGDALAWYEKSARRFEANGVYPYEIEMDLSYWKTRALSQLAGTKKLLSRIRTRPRSRKLADLAIRIGTSEEISRILPLRGKHSEVAVDLSSLLKAYPAHIQLRRHLFNYHRENGHQERALQLVVEGADENPLTPYDVYVGLLTEARANNGPENDALERTRARIKEAFPDESSNFEDHSRSSIVAWTAHDLERIAATLHIASVPAIWQTYPPLRNGERQWVDPIIQEIALRKDTPLVDTYANLKKILTSLTHPERVYSNQFGTTDPHLSNMGNELVARHLLEAVRTALLARDKP